MKFLENNLRGIRLYTIAAVTSRKVYDLIIFRAMDQNRRPKNQIPLPFNMKR